MKYHALLVILKKRKIFEVVMHLLQIIGGAIRVHIILLLQLICVFFRNGFNLDLLTSSFGL